MRKRMSMFNKPSNGTMIPSMLQLPMLQVQRIENRLEREHRDAIERLEREQCEQMENQQRLEREQMEYWQRIENEKKRIANLQEKERIEQRIELERNENLQEIQKKRDDEQDREQIANQRLIPGRKDMENYAASLGVKYKIFESEFIQILE